MTHRLPMRPHLGLKTARRLLASAIFLFGCLTMLHATPVTGTWTSAQGSAALGNTTTSSPTWGNGTTDNASASAIYSAFPLITLADVGDKLTMTGTADMFGIVSGNSVFRFGVFNENNSADTTGWLGYFVGNASVGTGVLAERNTSNTALYTSTTGATSLATVSSIGSTSLTTASNPVTYSFSFTLERTSTSALQISSSLFRPSDSAQFDGFTNVTDTTPLTFSFDRIGFQGTAVLAADRIQLHNIDVAYTSAIPEPAMDATLLSAVCLLGVVARRRIRA